ncbi:MAG: hypothetical protein GF355_02125 [Candidatus Eisenbacteria bacterium]|nr:hypothetical protein [Candidatus Eisenbacteria bacterium]
MSTALTIAAVIILLSIWFTFATYRLKSKNRFGRRYRTFRPKWSSKRKHRRPRFRRNL